ncbi:hypothetical protein [Prevotella melaninogenica]|uniref:hypothetical protein n=1 Tax=Prevotella melaninogenica TaxID=28132 RepID=UPI001C60497D|nr:hypothetical protein [Prevotella melaninogenica]MBW4730279.1 hypothetical protein [Prevotella melaninogenica]
MATAKLKGAEADYQLAVLHKRLSLILRPKSLSMPYSCRAYTLYGSPALQGWER